jgi:prolyl 4-hydroxylase
MTDQVITLELRQWIVTQAESGQSPDAVLSAMLASGWDEPVALVALEQTLTARIASRQAESLTIPDVIGAADTSSVWAGDRAVRVLSRMNKPRVVVLGDLLSAQECEELINEARPRLSRSETVVTNTGGSEINAARTSQGMFFGRGETPLCQTIEARLATLLNWPVEYGEGLQVLRYAPGAEYKPHYDYFDPSQPGTPSILQRGGQRVATLVMYLNTPEEGGSTTFPDAGLIVHASAGQAVFFSYSCPHPSTKTLHGGAPVIQGEKWVATKWLREGRFE